MSEKMENKIKDVTVAIKGDTTELMKSLDEVEKKVDLITVKLEKMNYLSSQLLDIYSPSKRYRDVLKEDM